MHYEFGWNYNNLKNAKIWKLCHEKISEYFIRISWHILIACRCREYQLPVLSVNLLLEHPASYIQMEWTLQSQWLKFVIAFWCSILNFSNKFLTNKFLTCMVQTGTLVTYMPTSCDKWTGCSIDRIRLSKGYYILHWWIPDDSVTRYSINHLLQVM